MPGASIPVAETARLLVVPEEEVRELADAGSRVALVAQEVSTRVSAVLRELVFRATR